MTRLEVFSALWASSWAVYSAVCLLIEVGRWPLHLVLLFVHLAGVAVQLACLAFLFRSIRIRRWRARHLTRLARHEILCRAWEAVLMDRAARGCSGVTHALLGLTRALDLAHSELARSGP